MEVAEPPACISESDKAHLGFAGDERSTQPRPTELCGNVVTMQSDPLRRCTVPLRGRQTCLVPLSPFATGDVSSALNAPVMFRHAPGDNAWRTPCRSEEMLRLISTASMLALFVQVTVIAAKCSLAAERAQSG